MVLANGEINIIADMEGTTGVKLHNNRQKLRSRFDIVRKLGQGTYGKVQLAINKDTGEEVAIKTIKKSKIETEQDLVRIQREIQIMSSVQHAHIIHIYEVFENREKIVLVMEYANGGELYDYLSFKKVLTEAEARRVFRQVVAAVYYCHKNMICHRDLKLENILLDERGNAKIADFGLSNIFDERIFLHTFCGSPLYASPEIVKGTPYFGPEVDCWSLGVLLYTLVYGAMPFDGSNFKRLVKQISEGDYYEPKVPSEASGLIRHMLTVEPSKRATVDDICCHVWVNVGEELSLLDVSQEMCQQMPVRLDYLLALSAAAAASAANNGTLPPADTDAKPTVPIEAPPVATDSNIAVDEDDESQWERPALQAFASESELDEQKHPSTTKKHKMTSSTSTPVLPNSSSHQVVHKKQRKEHGDDKKKDDSPADGNDKGGGGERVVTETKPEHQETTDIDMVAVNDNKTESATDTVATKTENDAKVAEVASDQVAVVSATAEQESAVKDDSKSVTVPPTEKTGPKRKTVAKKSTSTANTAAIAATTTTSTTTTNTTTTKTSGTDTNGTSTESAATKPINKVSKFRKSVSVGKEGSGSTSPSTPPIDAIAAAAAGTPPLSGGVEKRKTSFAGSSSSRIADARKAFERRSPEKKPIFLPGSKVNSVRRSFESPPATPEASPSVKGIAKPFVGIAERKSSLTAPTVAKKNGTTTTSTPATGETVAPPTQETPSDGAAEKKSVGNGSPLVKQLSRTNARTTSPTKNIRPADTGSHHKGCVPTEAKAAAAAAAAAAQEPKKPSPPKSLVRKNSLSKTGTGGSFSKSPSKEMKTTPTATPVAGRTVTPTTRPRSPTKALKTTSATPAAGKVASSSSTKSSTDTKATEVSEETSKTEISSQLPVEKLEVAKPEDVRLEKRGSIEIAPVPSSALVRRYPETDPDDDLAIAGPQLRFVPRDKGNFTLLGVKSEVVFDVPNDGEQQLAIEDVTGQQMTPPTPGEIEVVSRQPLINEPADQEIESDSKIIRYIATVRKHGSTSERGANTTEETGPERVTLLKLRCSTSQANDDGFSEPKVTTNSPPSSATTPDAKILGTKSPTIKISMKLGGGEQQHTEVQVDTEQRGYNVYRSKYHSVQKYRSFIERRGGDGDETTDHEEVQEVKRSTAATASATQSLPSAKERAAASVERSDSFSSTGSTDDLEDVFESLTSETLFTSLLSRTRNLIDRLADGGDNSSHSRWLRSVGRPSMLAAAAAGSRGFPSPLSSFALNSPSLSFRMNMAPATNATAVRSTYAADHQSSSTYRSSSSNTNNNNSPGIRDHRLPEDASPDVTRSDSSRRFRYSRSTTRSGDEDDDTASNISSRIRSTNASVSSSRVSFSNYNNSSSTLSDSREQQQQHQLRQSRYDASHRAKTTGENDVTSGRDSARSDIISALMRHRNRSLDDRSRPRSYYDVASPSPPVSSSRDWTPSSSFSSMRSPSSQYAQQQQQQQQQQSSSVRNRSFPEEPASLYGTTARRPGRFQRYSKSVTKELAEEYDTEESAALPRPRSLLVLSDLSADEDRAGSSTAVSPSEESVAAATSVTRDYSKSVSQEGSTRCEEERELEQKHRVTQLQNGVMTSSMRRETKRSVSQTEESDGGGSSTTSSTPTLTGLQQRLLLKKVSGDDLTRMDSGIGSLFESGGGSGPATPTSAGVSSRRGILKFARSISSELEEEINRIGGGLAGINETTPDDEVSPHFPGGSSDSKRRTSSEGPASDNGQADGSATPVSDSAETGSVCSDTASTDAPHKGSEEESVGERIRRKSFFARFNDTRSTRKNRKSSNSTALPSAAALRSELGRSSSLRHHIFESDSPLGGSSHRSYFDPTADFFTPPPLIRRCSGGRSDAAAAPHHHQRWSMFGGSNNVGSGLDGPLPFDPNDYLYGGDIGVPPLPRRGSQSSSYVSTSSARNTNNATDGQWAGEDHEASASATNLNRTHSLPEDEMPPRPVFRQHSMPGSNGASENPASGDQEIGAGESGYSPRGSIKRRPDRLNLYPPRGGGGQSAISPSEEMCDQSESGPGLSRRGDSSAGSPPGSARRSMSRPGRLGPLDAWDSVSGLHARGGHSLASLMDSLESPSEVLQKAMDLCDSLRFS